MGSSPTVTPTSESMDSVMKAMTANLPQYAKAINDVTLPTEQTAVDTNRVILPQQNQVQLDSLSRFLPQLTGLDTQDQQQRAVGTVNSDAAALQQSQQNGLIDKALALQRQSDPEYYKNRGELSQGLTDLSKFDPDHLSGSEVAETTRGLNQTAQGAPNLSGALSAAAKFGSALARRRGEKNSYLQTVAGALPTLRTGFDPYMVATGKNSGAGQAAMSNMGYDKQSGQTAQGFGSQMFNTGAGFQSQAAQNEFNKPTGLDQAGKIMGMAGQLIGGIAGGMM